jgi:hypothetical protein
MNYDRAPEPTDLFWENMDVKKKERFYRMMIVFLATMIIILGCFFTIYALDVLNRSYD